LATLTRQLQQLEDAKDGSKRKRFATVHVEAASMKRDHAARITELIVEAKEMDDSIRLNFEAQLEFCEKIM
jgi:hypothetical protein